jgi:hypothetical protein
MTGQVILSLGRRRDLLPVQILGGWASRPVIEGQWSTAVVAVEVKGDVRESIP